ncbi:MAG: hypothetical protein IAF02_03450 [Anaerolineae bacterium]|nr:hypothetical protein [Anaerolineae bacterium]
MFNLIPFFYFTMVRWLKRLLVVVFLAVWLVVMLFPCMAFRLAMQTEVQVGSNVRVFLVSEKSAEGVGVEWKRPFSSTDQQCVQTAVTYFMWVGEGENVTFCQCADTSTGEQFPSTLGICQ